MADENTSAPAETSTETTTPTTEAQTESQPPVVNPVKSYSINEAIAWLSSVVAPGNLLTPTDVRLLYVLLAYQFLNGHHVPADGNLENVTELKSNDDIRIPEPELARIAGIAFHPKFRGILVGLMKV